MVDVEGAEWDEACCQDLPCGGPELPVMLYADT